MKYLLILMLLIIKITSAYKECTSSSDGYCKLIESRKKVYEFDENSNPLLLHQFINNNVMTYQINLHPVRNYSKLKIVEFALYDIYDCFLALKFKLNDSHIYFGIIDLHNAYYKSLLHLKSDYTTSQTWLGKYNIYQFDVDPTTQRVVQSTFAPAHTDGKLLKMSTDLFDDKPVTRIHITGDKLEVFSGEVIRMHSIKEKSEDDKDTEDTTIISNLVISSGTPDGKLSLLSSTIIQYFLETPLLIIGIFIAIILLATGIISYIFFNQLYIRNHVNNIEEKVTRFTDQQLADINKQLMENATKKMQIIIKKEINNIKERERIEAEERVFHKLSSANDGDVDTGSKEYKQPPYHNSDAHITFKPSNDYYGQKLYDNSEKAALLQPNKLDYSKDLNILAAKLQDNKKQYSQTFDTEYPLSIGVSSSSENSSMY